MTHIFNRCASLKLTKKIKPCPLANRNSCITNNNNKYAKCKSWVVGIGYYWALGLQAQIIVFPGCQVVKKTIWGMKVRNIHQNVQN